MQLTPWDFPPKADDPAPRFAKPIPANDLHAIFEPRRPLIDWAVPKRIERRNRVVRQQRIIGVSCIILSVLCVGYMLAQLVRAVVS